jgi:single-strand DNA-binding protein
MSNTIVVKGNLTADAEVRFTPAGKQVLTFNLADNQGFGDNKTATFWRCQLWGERGEKLAPFLKKGNQTCVTGEASLRKYDKDGSERTSLEIRVNDVWLIGGKESSESEHRQAPKSANERQATASEAPASGGFSADFIDDLSF